MKSASVPLNASRLLLARSSGAYTDRLPMRVCIARTVGVKAMSE
jgi:hypothetical protein